MADETPDVCQFCEEPVLIDDIRDLLACGAPVHRECMVRSVIGSVAHIQKRCSCFIEGSTENDPEGMTKREAAKAARAALSVARYGDLLNQRGICPLCGSTEFHPGPTALRIARNIKCAGCGWKFWYSPPFAPTLIFNEDDCYNLAVRETLGR